MTTGAASGGPRVMCEPIPGALSVALGIWVGVGARDEPDALAGASHVLEHLLFKGTKTRTHNEINESVEAVGGDLNAFTAKESTTFHARVPARHWKMALDVLCDVTSEPTLDADDLESERQVIFEELAARDDTPDDLVHDLLAPLVFGDHPLGRDILGRPDTLAAMGRDDVAGFFSDHYLGDNVVVCAAGAFEPDELIAAVGDRYDGDPARRPDRHQPTPTAGVACAHRDIEQVHLAFGAPGLAVTDDDRFALAIAIHVLGGGTSSRLFEEVRERRGLSYSVYAYSSLQTDAGMVGVYVGTSAKRAPEAAQVVRAEIARMADDGVTERELDLAKGFAEGATALSLESTSARMHRLGSLALAHGHIPTVDEQLARYRAVTVDDVARVCREVLSADWSLAAVGSVDHDQVAGWTDAR